MASMFTRHLPILEWSARYERKQFAGDLMAAAVVTVMLIPQSLAYAALAGLPPEMGLYASIAPLVAYAVFGTSRTMAVGPVAIVSLMTASAASAVARPGSPLYVQSALVLAFMSGVMMLIMGLCRMGGLAKLLSTPVVNGFTIASSLLIAVSQIGPLIGVRTSGQSLWDLGRTLASHLGEFNPRAAGLGLGALGLLVWIRGGLKPLLLRLGLKGQTASLLARAGPVLAIAATTLAVKVFHLSAAGVATVGALSSGLPPLTLPPGPGPLWFRMALPALFISIIGFVSSISVARTLAAKRRQRVHPSQELVGLGMANIASALTGGFPITGGFGRSVVNFDAGAETPAAGAFTAVGLAIAAFALMPLLQDLPIPALSATILAAVLSLLDVRELSRVWRYSRQDFMAMAVTLVLTTTIGVEVGLGTGVAISILLTLYRSSNPHAAIVGLLPGSQHFRNVDRYNVITSPEVVSLRIDESLGFTNAQWLEEKVLEVVADQPAARHVVLMCSAVNDIDSSALESLMSLIRRLADIDVKLHLSEVKGPVMDRLRRSTFMEALTGCVFLSQYDAFRALAPGVCDSRPPRIPENVGGDGI